MPRIALKSENKKTKGFVDFPKLKLEHGEQVRIFAGLETPEMQYSHELRKPKIDDAGNVVMEQAKNKAGETYERIEMVFVAANRCTGNFDVLEDAGIDPDGCKMCAFANEHPDMASAPVARYAMNVFVYKTKPGSFNLSAKFGGEVVVWSLSQTRMNQLIDIAEQFDGLDKNDLNLGPCESKQFQKYTIQPAGNAALLSDAENKKDVFEAFEADKVEDLAAVCAREKEDRWVVQDIKDIKQAWADAKGATATSKPSTDTDLKDDLNALIDSTPADIDADPETGEVWSAPAEKEEASLADILSEAQEEPEAPKAAVKSAPIDAEDDDDDDDAIMALLNGPLK